MPSIRQNISPNALPDLANLGVLARILLGACLFGLLVAVIRAASAAELVRELALLAAAALLPLLFNLSVLAIASRWLRRLPYRGGIVLVFVLCLAASTAAYRLQASLLGIATDSLERHWLYTAIIVALLLGYFDLRGRALSPALAEARLQALQARIRPHFLFNSINAVLSLIRSEPKRAETALEDMAELFRVLMADNLELTPLKREVELCRQYLDLEQLRLGERLQVEWHVERMPADAMVPPLVLQPLLENAVYHGIEPRTQPGVVSINVYRKADRVHAVLRNPYKTEGSHHAGNKMALNNIRERLQLHFDAEASLKTSVDNQTYQVHITLPYRPARA
ncbi:MAG: histidine kinase [Burkholderiales bacterium]|nr:histidine kinase [Burkholderiales bacterium]